MAYYRVYYVSKDLHLDGRGKAVEKVLNQLDHVRLNNTIYLIDKLFECSSVHCQEQDLLSGFYLPLVFLFVLNCNILLVEIIGFFLQNERIPDTENVNNTTNYKETSQASLNTGKPRLLLEILISILDLMSVKYNL